MSLAAEVLGRARCHCGDGDFCSEYCRNLASRIIAGNY